MAKRLGVATVLLASAVAFTACARAPQAVDASKAQVAASSAQTSQWLGVQLDRGEPSLQAMPPQSLSVPASATRAPAPWTHGNSARLFVGPQEHVPAITSFFASAQKSLYLEVFNLGAEGYGEKVVPILCERARAGVEVKVNIDWVGSRFLKGHKQMVKQLREAGVDVRVYMPRTIKKDDRQVGINITHRKVYLVDGVKAMVGGVNLMKEFDTTTQDLMVEWRGPVVPQLYQEFAFDWGQAGGGVLREQPVGTPAGNADAQIVVTSPREGRFEARDAFVAAINGAQSYIEIQNQYLWDDRLIDALEAAAKRGVKMRLMVPGAEHNAIFRTIHSEDLQRLVALGAEARVYHGADQYGHLHSKYYMVDGRWAATGSTNGDTRAMMDNQEIQILTTDKALIQGLSQRLFQKDWEHHSLPFVYKPSNVVSKPFRRLLEVLDYYL